ncbi:MAG: EscU/YscU/HrcU family type III secretion system export apparatus switch protein [Christensenellales bacterium]|jgi:flagellar biosynthesis protein
MKDDINSRQAAALKYDPETADAPYVVALGKGYIAERIIESAREEGIQIVRDDKLSHMLQKLSVGDEIPEELYQVVAEVLVFVSNMDEKYSQRFGVAKNR